jgi:hypothetical protein
MYTLFTPSSTDFAADKHVLAFPSPSAFTADLVITERNHSFQDYVRFAINIFKALVVSALIFP